MQFQPTALILSAAAQREHFDGVRYDTAGSGMTRSDRPGAASRVRARRDHRVRRSVAALLVRAAGAIEPCPAQRMAARG